MLAQIGLKPALLADELHEPVAGVMVVLVRPKVFRQVLDAAVEQGNLHLRRTGVRLVLAVLGDDRCCTHTLLQPDVDPATGREDAPDRPGKGSRPSRRSGMVGTVQVPPDEVIVKVSRSGGPGGQHANTSETRVELAWHVTTSAVLTDAQRALLLERVGPVVRAVAEDSRSQARNREIAFERLAIKVSAALFVHRTRRPTRPTKGSIERRLTAKRRTATHKRNRQADHPDD